MNILHLTSRTDWKPALTLGAYRAASLDSEGFIHCSRVDQILKVAETFYKGQSDLILLEIDPSRLKAELKWEPPAGGAPHGVVENDLFPHIYGALNLDAVVAVHALQINAEGFFQLPSTLANR